MEVDGRVAGIDSRAARDGGRSRWRTLAGYVCFSFLPTGRREKGYTAGKGAGQGSRGLPPRRARRRSIGGVPPVNDLLIIAAIACGYFSVSRRAVRTWRPSGNLAPKAARAKRLRLPRSLSDDGKAWVTVDFAGIRHTPLPPREAYNVALAAKGALQSMFSHSQLAREIVRQK
jgi:hypothetical protein